MPDTFVIHCVWCSHLTRWLFILSRYDMWHKNCNHFCDAFCERLSSRCLSGGLTLPRIPLWINRLTSSGAVLWDRALWTQRVVDKVRPHGKANASKRQPAPVAEQHTLVGVAEAGRSQPHNLLAVQNSPMPLEIVDSTESQDLPPLPPFPTPNS